MKNEQMNRFCLKSTVFFLIPGILIWVLATNRPAQAQAPNYLHTEGHRILDSNGNQVVLTGLNWFGLETESYAPHGLWARNLESILDQIVELGFNTIRLHREDRYSYNKDGEYTIRNKVTGQGWGIPTRDISPDDFIALADHLRKQRQKNEVNT